jgi:hypothetical protein
MFKVFDAVVRRISIGYVIGLAKLIPVILAFPHRTTVSA